MKFTKLENYTGKAVLVNLGLRRMSIAPTSDIAVCKLTANTRTHTTIKLDGIPLIPVNTTAVQVVGLCDEVEGVGVIVTNDVMLAYPNRKDLLSGVINGGIHHLVCNS